MTVGGSSLAAELAALKPWPTRAPAITADDRAARIAMVRAEMAARGIDALLVTAGASLRYFAGVPWGATERLVALLLPIDGEPAMICPRFELGSLEAVLGIPADIRLWEEDEDPFALAAAGMAPGVTLALDPALPFGMVERLRRAAPGLALVDGGPAIDACRMAKSPAEIALMQQAMDMTLAVHRSVARALEPGISNHAVIRFIDEAHRALGAAGSTFCSVQFGRATAYPHGIPGEQRLADNQLVLVDTGCLVDGYHSDITRSYAFGQVDDDARAIWDVEKEAQAAAFAAAVPGAPCESVDAAARAVLAREGLGPDYRLPGLPHRTGHGIGLQIHEPAYLVRGDRTPLATGMCFSDEPMIVVPDRFGIRLEDHFYMTDAGARWFTEPQPAIDRLG